MTATPQPPPVIINQPVSRTEDHDLLVRLDTKMDYVISNDADKERRLRSLERWRWMLMGASTAAGAVAGFVAQYIGAH